MKDDYLKLYSNCFPIFGYRRGLMIDLHDALNSNFIPHGMFEIISKCSRNTIVEVKNEYSNKEFCQIVDDYIEFLLKNDFAFLCSRKELCFFPKMNLVWKSPSTIENSIIDINIFNISYLNKIVSELSLLRCNALQIRFENTIEIAKLEEICYCFEDTRLLHVELHIEYTPEFNLKDLLLLIDMYPRLQLIMVYNSPSNLSSNCSKVSFTTKSILPKEMCGHVSSNYFSINISTFTESQLHNTCLNRKICIDSDGYIKNCPSMKHHYGHISDTTLAEAIEKSGFKDCWFIKKDDIDVCQDCEFRHICTDCRAFIKDPNNIYSQPAKCPYNPYVAKWQHEEGWISVEQWRTENPGWEEQAIELRELQKKFVDSNNE